MFVERHPLAAPAPYADRSWSSAEGLALHARDYPAADGPARLPVICIHGLTRNARDFEDLAPTLAAGGRRVLAVDVRGRGLSAWDPDPRNYHPATYAADVIALMDDLGLARAHFIGSSMGGLVLMAIASMQRDRVAGVVLNDVGPELGEAGMARIRGYVGRNDDMRDWRDAATYARLQNAHALPHYQGADWDRVARRLFRADAAGRPVLDYDPAVALPLKSGAGPSASHLWVLWAGLSGGRPLLALRGETSDVLTARTFDRMRLSAHRAEFVEVPGVGHAPMLDEPAALDAILGFMAANP